MTGKTREEAPVSIATDDVEVRTTEIGGGMCAAFLRMAKGTDMREALKGLPEDMCQCPHWGYISKGRADEGGRRVLRGRADLLHGSGARSRSS